MNQDDSPAAAPLLFSGGTVRCSADVVHDAIAIGDGRVLAVGTVDEVRAATPGGSREIDIDGAAVIPGLVDTHPHLVHFAGLAAHLVDIGDAVDHADIVGRIARRAANEPDGTWLMATPVGEGHYYIRRSWRDLAEGRLPDRSVLDRASSTHPIFIQAWAPVTPNVCAFNSAALAVLGIDEQSPDEIDEVTIHKDAAGRPTGLLTGAVNNYYNRTGYMFSLFAKMPPLIQPEAAFPAVIEAMHAYNALGVTTVYEAHAMDYTEIGLYEILRDMGLLTVRAMVAPEAELCGVPWAAPLTDREFAARLRRAADTQHADGDLLRQRGVTLQLGGPCWPGLMLARSPYVGPDGQPTTGVDFIGEHKARQIVEFCAEEHLRLNIVSVADAEHDRWLDLLDATPRGAGEPWILQHAFFMTPEHCRRYRQLDFDVTTSMSFSWGKGDMFAERVGEQCLDDLIPLGRMLEAGLRVGCGSDWGPKNIFEHMWLAMTHEFAGSGRSNLRPAQTVSRAQAFDMWTGSAAAILGWDGIGRLVPGAHADVVIVDRDPVDCPLDSLVDTEVVATLLGGATVHDTGFLG